MPKTKPLSNEEYGGIPFYLPDVIQNHVNREQHLIPDRVVGGESIQTKQPKFVKAKVERNKVWWWNFFRSSVYQLMP